MKNLIIFLIFITNTLICHGQMLQAIVGQAPTAPTTQVVGLAIPVGSISAVNRFANFATTNTNTETDVQALAPISGTITELYCSAATVPSGGSNVISLFIGGVSAATCTITTGQHRGSTTGLSVAITAGTSLLDVKLTTLTTSSRMSLMARVEGVATGTVPLGFGTFSSSYATGSTRFWSLTQSNGSAGGTALGSPLGGTLSAIYAQSSITAGASEIFTFCDITNSSTCVSSGIIGTCTLSGRTTACTGLSGTVTKGHLTNMSAANTSGSTAVFSGWGVVTGETTNVSVLEFTTYAGTIAAAGGQGVFGLGSFEAGTTEADVSVGSPVGGTAAELYALCSQNPTGAGHVFTLNVNGSATALTCSTGATNPYCSDVAHTASITKGQTVSITATNSNATTATNCGAWVRVTGSN